MNILELRVKFGIFKESNTLKQENLQKELEEKMSFIFKHLEKLHKDEVVSDIIVDKEAYLNLISNMAEYFLSTGLQDEVCDYFNFITEVLFNWNKNTVKNKQIEIFSLMLNRLIECRNTFQKSTIVMKESYERYVELANWQPPVFDLAVEYFDKLLEENEKGKIE
jgi:hypothetical protein